jgi:hypothetical protein
MNEKNVNFLSASTYKIVKLLGTALLVSQLSGCETLRKINIVAAKSTPASTTMVTVAAKPPVKTMVNEPITNGQWTRIIIGFRTDVKDPGMQWLKDIAKRSKTTMRFVTAAGPKTFAVTVNEKVGAPLDAAMARLQKLPEISSVEIDGRVSPLEKLRK